MPRKRYVIPGVLLMVAVVTLVGFRSLNPPRHLHCIKGATIELANYAEKSGGLFPSSENGWADALLALNEHSDSNAWIPVITGVDDDGSVFRGALTNGTDIDESKCTRIYVQGWSTASDPSIAILFDRNSTRGGDHFRSPLREPLREVILVGGSHKMIKDRDWPAFVKSQRILLREAGLGPVLFCPD